MAMQGNLQDMAVADLIQHNCQDRKTAQLQIDHNGQQAALFFKDGAVQHATLDDAQGEEVIYQILNWQEGRFTLDMDIEPPAITIERSWSGLLLEGARRLDETAHPSPENGAEPSSKSELLAETLTGLLAAAGEVDGVAVVGLDGLVYAAHVSQKALDETMVGATSAAILGLSRRSAGQLKRGNFNQTLIQGDAGNIIVTGLNREALLVGLTSAEVNLGMAFAEIREMSKKLTAIL